MAVNQRLLQALMDRHMAAALPATTRRDPVTRAPGLLEQWQQQYPYQQGRPEMGFDPEAAQANIVPGLVERGMDVRTMIEEPVETGVGLAELAKGALQVAGAAPTMAVGSRRAREAARRRLEGNPVAMMLQGGIREMRDLVGEKGVMGALGSMANRPVDVAEMMLGVTPAGAVPRAAKAAKAAKAARRPWGAKAPVEEFGEQVLQKHGLADLEIYEVGDDIKISMIAVPKDQQGQGIGSAAMQDIVDFADQHGKRLILTPGPIESRWGQTSTASQKRFYKKFGFVENKGDDKDFRIKDSMYRAPQELQAASEPDDFWQWMLKEMPEGPEKELLRKEATEGRAKAAQLEKFITETEPAPTRIPWNLGGDPNRPAQMIITPSVKEPGRWQGTLIDERGPISDINRDTYEEVIRELAGDYNLDLSKAEVRAAPKAQTLEERAAAADLARKGSVADIPSKKGETMKLYHGSNSGSIDAISDKGLFGGVFAGDRGSAESHIITSGGVLHEIEIPEEKVLTQRALDYDLPFEEVQSALKRVANNNYLNVDDDTLDLLYSLIIEEKNVFDFPDEGPVLKALDMASFEDLGEASWKAQRLRGEVAKDLGYQAVETSDEHGTSYLVLPGASIKPIKTSD